MLNGRRVAASGIGSSVDVNNLPQVLIDRVEIITGGAATAVAQVPSQIASLEVAR